MIAGGSIQLCMQLPSIGAKGVETIDKIRVKGHCAGFKRMHAMDSFERSN
jgi:hypothetical protein